MKYNEAVEYYVDYLFDKLKQQKMNGEYARAKDTEEFLKMYIDWLNKK